MCSSAQTSLNYGTVQYVKIYDTIQGSSFDIDHLYDIVMEIQFHLSQLPYYNWIKAIQSDWETRSPGSTNKDKGEIQASPPKSNLEGTICVPGSKSLTNRALVIASLAEGKGRFPKTIIEWLRPCL